MTKMSACGRRRYPRKLTRLLLKQLANGRLWLYQISNSVLETPSSSLTGTRSTLSPLRWKILYQVCRDILIR